MLLNMKTLGVAGHVDVMVDSPWESRGGKKIGSLDIKKNTAAKAKDVAVKLSGIDGLSGKHGVYLVFSSPVKKQSMCEIYNLCLQGK
jgi:hypothetical protein